VRAEPPGRSISIPIGSNPSRPAHRQRKTGSALLSSSTSPLIAAVAASAKSSGSRSQPVLSSSRSASSLAFDYPGQYSFAATPWRAKPWLRCSSIRDLSS
jgi:hypothetical protein